MTVTSLKDFPDRCFPELLRENRQSYSVFHLRLRDFELQAERALDAALRTRAVAIISSHRPDGTVVALSREAREEGLYPGMKVALARRMSHSALLLPYNRPLYRRLNHYLYATLSSFAPVVEPAAFGQFYLDMTGMDGVYPSARQAGVLITRAIREKTCLTGTVGISVNKLVSRIATAVVPERIHEVAPGAEARFLAPLDSPVLPTTHATPVQKLIRFLYLTRVHHLQQVTAHPREAETLFGPFARRLTREARGQDTAAVRPPRLRDHLLEQTVLPTDTNDEDLLRAVVKLLAEQIAFQLRQRRQIARRVRLEIHYTDGFQSGRTGTLTANDDPTVVRTCHRLFEQANYRRNRIRTILIDAADFQPYAQQLEAFTTPEARNLALSRALDRIRGKHGPRSVLSAAALPVIAPETPPGYRPSTTRSDKAGLSNSIMAGKNSMAINEVPPIHRRDKMTAKHNDGRDSAQMTSRPGGINDALPIHRGGKQPSMTFAKQT
jgi:DNA polymerase-4